MSKTMHTLLLGAVLTGSIVFSSTAFAEITGNIGVTSNYIWRGMTQTIDQDAVSGGVDYAHKSGFYAGGWTSNLGGGEYELDLYAGYGMKTGPVDLDFGATSYQYPVNGAYFHEGYANVSYKMFGGGAAYILSSDDDNTAEFSNGDIYLFMNASHEIKKGLKASITIGNYNFKDSAGDDYSHIQLSASKDNLIFAIDKNDRSGPDEDKARISVSWSKGFKL